MSPTNAGRDATRPYRCKALLAVRGCIFAELLRAGLPFQRRLSGPLPALPWIRAFQTLQRPQPGRLSTYSSKLVALGIPQTA